METTLDCKIDWMSVGAEHCQDKAGILAIIERMEWDFDFKGKSIAMGPALAIQGVIKEMKMPKVTAISYSCHEMAPYGLYGIEANYKNAKIRLFVLDLGTHCTPLCTFVWEI